MKEDLKIAWLDRQYQDLVAMNDNERARYETNVRDGFEFKPNKRNIVKAWFKFKRH